MVDFGFFNRLGEPADKAQAYRQGVELFQHAERIGFTSAWVPQHYLPTPVLPDGALPSPWIFLAYLAARTERLELATAVTVLSLEDPIRLAQDTAVLDALTGGRVHLGLGSGLEPDTFALFAQDYAAKYDLFDERFPRLVTALRGEPANGSAFPINPADPELADARLWQGAHSHDSAVRVGERGLNLLLDANTFAPGRTPSELQREWLDAYLDALPAGKRTRVAVVRALIPTDELGAVADEAVFHDIDQRVAGFRIKNGLEPVPEGTPLRDKLALQNVHYAPAAEIADRLIADPVITAPAVTDVIVQINPAHLDHDRLRVALDGIAEGVLPAFSTSVPEPVGAY